MKIRCIQKSLRSFTFFWCAMWSTHGVLAQVVLPEEAIDTAHNHHIQVDSLLQQAPPTDSLTAEQIREIHQRQHAAKPRMQQPAKHHVETQVENQKATGTKRRWFEFWRNKELQE
jgi:hypothetical protein